MVSLPAGHMNETEGCTEMLTTHQGYGACSDSQDLRRFSLQPCDSCFMTVHVKRSQICLYYASQIDLGKWQIVRSHENTQLIAN